MILGLEQCGDISQRLEGIHLAAGIVAVRVVIEPLLLYLESSSRYNLVIASS
jgi:hypothetical protein